MLDANSLVATYADCSIMFMCESKHPCVFKVMFPAICTSVLEILRFHVAAGGGSSLHRSHETHHRKPPTRNTTFLLPLFRQAQRFVSIMNVFDVHIDKSAKTQCPVDQGSRTLYSPARIKASPLLSVCWDNIDRRGSMLTHTLFFPRNS